MGKYYAPPSDSFCEHVFKFLKLRFQNELEFYTPDISYKKKKKLKGSKYGIKLLTSSTRNLNIDNEVVENNRIVSYVNPNIIIDYKEDSNFTVVFNEGVDVSRKDLIDKEHREDLSASFKKFVHKKLCERLENEIKLTTKRKSECTERLDATSGILLFKTADSIIKNINKPGVLQQKIKRKSKEVDLKDRLLECAVSPEWIINRVGTDGWRETKRIRLQQFKCVKNLSDGAMECDPV